MAKLPIRMILIIPLPWIIISEILTGNISTIHIAGTNGKGSVSHMIASVLQEAGYKTGLVYFSASQGFQGKDRVNGEMIPER